ncbi:SMI1/KNR4 family protein [Flavobacterium branchiophilum]|uniref:SMI1/KNR4 family protein n=1 Tax=Flavobacterium branchiophilum (strain FL-15) TaxID=1034807 RepID=G2Z5M2_FLABF|nr:hypothetical protein [Flavobacterium branchiophilum]CCB70820.1 Hypothetical protein FBFL15_2848 [Flavobacterium branchiophilum FL-15]
MFEINIEKEIEKFIRRNTLINNLNKIPIRDNFYNEYISKYKSHKLNADIDIFDYEKTLVKNSYIKKNYPNLSENLWIIADSGQGDEWFLSKRNEKILFYDHNKGEYVEDGFIEMDLTFKDFLQLGLILNKLEEYLGQGIDEEIFKKPFIENLNKINKNLFNIYPYKYF